jgi:hypothetical protein
MRANWRRHSANMPPEEDTFLYTMDLLMEDFGKKHLPQYCVLCEPMKVVGKHRDEVMVELLVVLFTTFFPSFQDYILETKEALLQGLLDRREKKSFDSWQNKLAVLLQRQMEEDLKDFLNDIQRHLLKYSGVEIEADKFQHMLTQAMFVLKEEWMRKGD